jgi:small subunit ribosomal protein S2
MPYINMRWLGGMLTNFETMHKRVGKMKEYQRMRDSGEFAAMPKKEALKLSRELEKLERNLGGIRNLERPPHAVFILDTKKEDIAVTEANKLGIPIVAVVDTNCDPDIISYVIPGNDDAIRAGNLLCRVIADAVDEGRFIASRRHGNGSGPGPAPAPKRTQEDEAAVAAQQAGARRQAAAAAAEREARIAAGRTSPAASAPSEGPGLGAAAGATEAEAPATVAVAVAEPDKALEDQALSASESTPPATTPVAADATVDEAPTSQES